MIQSRALSKGSNREIAAERKILAGVLMLLMGGERIEDIEVLRQDKSLVGSLGWANMVGPDALLNYLGEKRTGGVIRGTNETLGLKAMRESELKEFTYDNDATYFNSNKDCAKWSYQEANQLSALLGFIPELSGLCITMDYRPGNISPRDGIVNQLRKAIAMAVTAGKRIGVFRSDSAACSKEIFRLCEASDIRYFVSIAQNVAVKDCIKEIPSKDWKALPEQTGKEYAVSRYWMQDVEKGPVEIRIMVLRWVNVNPSLFDQDSYGYHVIGTNDNEINPLEWLALHNGRSGSENYNKEVKTGFSGDYTPSHNFVKNRNYFLMSILAYNLMQILKMNYLGETAKTWTVKTLRYWFLDTCGKFVRHARKVCCHIINATQETYALFETCLQRLVCASG